MISQVIYNSGALAPIIALILYPALAPTPITTDPITIVVSIIYGPFIGTIIAIAGNMMSAVVEYRIGIGIGKATNFSKTRDKLPFHLGRLPVNSPGFLIFGRMVPGYGSKIISFLAGTYKVPMRRYLWTTLVTTVAGSILLAYGGFGIFKLVKFTKVFKIFGI